MLMTPQEMSAHIAKQVKTARLAKNLSQLSLSKRSGVSYGSLKKFESSGQISLKSLLKLATVLNAMDGFHDLFSQQKAESEMTLDQLLQENTRKRGRQ